MIKPLFIYIILCLSSLPVVAGQFGYIKAGQLHIYFEKTGKGSPLVLVHGGYLDLHSWDKVTLSLAKKYTIIRFDLPGHGKTTGSDTAIQIQEVFKIMMDSLHIVRASFVGLSLGASCVVDFALAYPKMIDKVVLTSSGLNGWADVMQLDTLSEKLFNQSNSVFKSNNHDLITESFTHLWCDGPFRKPSEVNHSVRNYVYRTVAVNDLKSDKSWPLFNTDKAAKRVNTISNKVLILAGDKDVPFILCVAKFLHNQIKHSKLYIVKGSAHMINLEKPMLFQVRLRYFLES